MSVSEIGHTSRDQKYRHSLQPKSAKAGPSNLRHTQSHIYTQKKIKARPPPPAIPEVEISEEVDVVRISIDATNENVKLPKSDRKHSKHSRSSRKSSQSSSKIAFDNVAFESEKDESRVSRSSSAANSVRSSIRDPSVENLRVVHEQYCCCSRWTPCERTLFAAVGVLIFIIILLIIAVILVSLNNRSDKKSDKLLNNLFDFHSY